MKKQENPPAFFVVGINFGATAEREKGCEQAVRRTGLHLIRLTEANKSAASYACRGWFFPPLQK